MKLPIQKPPLNSKSSVGSLFLKKRKSGYILATCIVVMVVIMALCMMMLALVTYYFTSDRLEARKLDIRIEIDGIGEDFAADGLINSELYTVTAETNTLTVISSDRSYYFTIESNILILKKTAEDDSALLKVERGDSGNIYQWTYKEQ